MNLQENIRRILRENRKPSNFLRRRLGMLDYEVESKFYEIENRVETYSGIDICVIYDSGVRLFETIMENSIDAMYYNYFSNIDDNSEEWTHTYLDMVNYIRNKYQHKIMKYYDDNCGSGSIPLKESIRRVLREESNPKQDLYYEFKCTDADEDGTFYDTCFGEIDSTEFAQFIDDMESYEISEEEFKDKFTLTKSINKIINNPESEEWLEFYDKSEEDGYVVIFDGDIHYIYSV